MALTSRRLDDIEQQDLVENACDFAAHGIFSGDTLVAVCNPAVARVIIDTVDAAEMPSGPHAWLWTD